MRISFLIFSATIAIKVCALIFSVVFDIPGLFGIPYNIAKYLSFIINLCFYSSLFAFSLGVYKRVTSAEEARKLERMSSNGYSVTPETVAGVAVSSLLPYIFVTAMAAWNDNMPVAALIYLGFVVTCGLLINVPIGTKIKSIFLLSLWPAATFLVTSCGLLYVANLLNEDFKISGGYAEIGVKELVTTYVILSIAAIPAITAASIGRNAIIQMTLRLMQVQNESLENLEKNIKIIVSILALVGSAILGHTVLANN